jgi:hypothetical protein
MVKKAVRGFLRQPVYAAGRGLADVIPQAQKKLPRSRKSTRKL